MTGINVRRPRDSRAWEKPESEVSEDECFMYGNAYVTLRQERMQIVRERKLSSTLRYILGALPRLSKVVLSDEWR